MVGFTHLAVGLAAGVAAGLGGAPASLAACAAGSLLPDLDHPGSAAGRVVPGSAAGRAGRVVAGGALVAAGVWLKSPWLGLVGAGVVWLGFLGHRGVTHSLAALGAAYLLCRHLAPGCELPLAAGWVVHLGLDALTPAGVPLLWPWSWRLKGPVRSGGWADRLLGLAAAAWLVLGAVPALRVVSAGR